MRPMLVMTLAAMASLTLAGQAQTPEPLPQGPTFKTGVEVVTMDVGVTDERGRPVRDLRTSEFLVKVDGKPRRVVSAKSVFFDVAAAKKEAASGEEPFLSSNIGPPNGRMILIAVDQANIRPGAVRQLLKTAAAFLERLGPADQVAFVAYPSPGPEVGFTTNHLRVKQAMEQVVGNQQTFQGKFNIGMSEALSIHERNDEMVMKIVVDRECTLMRRSEGDLCSREVQAESAERTQHIRQESSISLQGLQILLRKLALLEGQKTLILMSEGLVIDDVSGDIDEIARLAARARASVNVLLMDVPRVDVTQALLPPTPTQDRALQTKGLEDLAMASRGTLFQVMGTGQAAFDRLTSELSGYYVLGVEETPGDRNGKPHRLDVQILRRGLTLRSHRAFVLSSAVDGTRRPNDSLLDALNSPFAVTELPMRVTNFAFQDPDNLSKVRVVISAEVGQAGAAAAPFTVGYVLFDSQGRVVSSASEKKKLTSVDGRDNAPLEYLASAQVDPGVYTLRFGAVDEQGRRGSVVRDVRAWKLEGEAFAVGDLMIGNAIAPGDPTRQATALNPQVEPHIYDNRMGVYVELYAAERANFDGTSVTVEIADDQDAAPLTTMPVQYLPGSRPTTIVAQAIMPTDMLPPGRYVARAQIVRAGKPAGVLLRPFILAPSPAALASAVGAPLRLSDWVPKFDRDSVLKAEVVTSMLDLVQRASPTLKDAMVEARAGRYGAAALEALTVGDQPAAMFMRGLDFLTKGQLDQAATQFNNASGPRREYFPAAFYLGACFAAGGRDQEAAGVWQIAIGAEARPGLVYVLFADARLRAGQPASVIDVLGPARDRVPGDEAIAKRLAVAYVITGRPADALPLLDEYLTRHPGDQEALFSMVVSQYQVTSHDRVPLSNVTRGKLARYAKAYKGPQQALLAKYVAAMDAK